MVDAQWLAMLGELTAQLLTAEYSKEPDDAHLLALLKQAHVLYVQLYGHVDGHGAAFRDNDTCTGPCLYMSAKPDRNLRALVASVRHGGHDQQQKYTQLVEEVRGAQGAVAVCAVTGIPCQHNTEQRVGAQVLGEAKQLLQYAQQLVKSRVLELEAAEELKTSLQGGAATHALARQFAEGKAGSLIDTLFTCLPCDDAMRADMLAGAGSVDAVLRPLTLALPPRMRHQAPLVKHAFAKRWSSACTS